MEISIGTFNLNNLFGRWNLFAEGPQPPPTRAPALAETSAARTPTAAAPDRKWLEEAPAVEERTAAARRKLPDPKIVIEGSLTADGIRWRTNPYDRRVVYEKEAEATKKCRGELGRRASRRPSLRGPISANPADLTAEQP